MGRPKQPTAQVKLPSTRDRWNTPSFFVRMMPGFKEEVIEALHMGPSPSYDAQVILLNAVAEWLGERVKVNTGRPGVAAISDPTSKAPARELLKRCGDDVKELGRLWRVEAAAADVDGLEAAVDNDAPADRWREQIGAYESASVAAAESTVAAWLA
jgi:hypothetical protein